MSVCRIAVVGACEVRCPSCVACPPQRAPRSLAELLAAVQRQGDVDTLILGGGDSSGWEPLGELLQLNRQRQAPWRVWLTAPARALDTLTLQTLSEGGVSGVIVQIEGAGQKMTQALGVGDGEQVIAEAEDLGLETRALLCVRPKTFSSLLGLAQRIAPRLAEVEFIRNNWGEEPIPLWPALVARAFRGSSNLSFTTSRMSDRGYLPPCSMPELWALRPMIWRSTFNTEAARNTRLPSCATCVLADRCQFQELAALPPELIPKLEAIQGDPEPWARRSTTRSQVPLEIRHLRPGKEAGADIVCVTPWTTMEVVDPDGRVRQCCSTWTVGDRGNVTEATLSSVWNGAGYQQARRIMSGRDLSGLCESICSRQYDLKFSEQAFQIQSGSKAFVDNQLLLACDIAERREVLRGRPLRMALCPSTYCNYDCIMCDLGRSPRRELPDSIWEEMPEFLPTLQSLTLLGGEPLANPRTMKLLRDFDVEKYPDASIDLITNGSLLTEAALKHLHRCTLGDITMSLNAGTAEVYAKVQRGVPFEEVLANLDALLNFRAAHHRWFGITLSFVVQPANAHTLLQFAELARVRNLPIRLMALNPEQFTELDFYPDPEAVAGVVKHLDALIVYCERHRPDWLPEVRSSREAVLEEAKARQAGNSPSLRVLP